VTPSPVEFVPPRADQPCPCGAGPTFAACCQPILAQQRPAETAEQLMRSRFTAHVARQVPELKVDLPPTAIGKDYLTNGDVVARAPSGTGWQVSLFGALGVLAGVEEGIEVNFLGLVFGVDPLDFALKLPIVGRVAPAPPVNGPQRLIASAGEGS